MPEPVVSKRQQNSARTREKLIDAAVQLYGNGSIDGVSLREISVAAGQRNPNALQYHFGGRDGLLQAIVDKHATRIGQLREEYIGRANTAEWTPGEAAARCLVMPIVEYVEANPDGVNFVKLVSQIAAIYQNGTVSNPGAGVQFPRTRALEAVFDRALSAVPAVESQRRIYLVVTITFHTIADVYRASQQSSASPIANKKPMVDQLICLLDAFFSAPAQQAG
ncbi:MAG: TetR/AcrR family transcriptional regulator [Halioglobus sp.]